MKTDKKFPKPMLIETDHESVKIAQAQVTPKSPPIRSDGTWSIAQKEEYKIWREKSDYLRSITAQVNENKIDRKPATMQRLSGVEIFTKMDPLVRDELQCHLIMDTWTAYTAMYMLKEIVPVPVFEMCMKFNGTAIHDEQGDRDYLLGQVDDLYRRWKSNPDHPVQASPQVFFDWAKLNNIPIPWLEDAKVAGYFSCVSDVRSETAPGQTAVLNKANAEIADSMVQPKVDWRYVVQAEAYEHWLRLRARGCSPSVYSISQWLATWCIENNVKGGKGQFPSSGTIRNSVIAGKNWIPPQHSVAQAKKHVDQIAQTSQQVVAQTAREA